jgi:hypothetical protein
VLPAAERGLQTTRMMADVIHIDWTGPKRKLAADDTAFFFNMIRPEFFTEITNDSGQ